MAISCLVASTFMYKQKILIAQQSPFPAKLLLYQNAIIIRYAPLEAASLFNIISYFITSNFLFLIIAIVMILYFIFMRPTADKAAEELILTYEEKSELEN